MLFQNDNCSIYFFKTDNPDLSVLLKNVQYISQYSTHFSTRILGHFKEHEEISIENYSKTREQNRINSSKIMYLLDLELKHKPFSVISSSM